jgi:WD40 repeat protein
MSRATVFTGALLFALLLLGMGASWYSEQQFQQESEVLQREIVEFARRGEARVRTLAYSPDGSALACGLEDGQIQFHDPETGAPLGTPLRQEGGVRSLAFTPDGHWLVSAGGDNALMLAQLTVWHSGERRLQVQLEMPPGLVQSVAFSPNGEALAAAGADGTVHLWQTASWRRNAILRVSRSPIAAVAFDPRGQHLAVGADDGTLSIWRLADLHRQHLIPAHCGVLWSLAYSPDGTKLASGGEDGARLWRCGEFQDASEKVTRDGHCRAVGFTPDARQLVVAHGGVGAPGVLQRRELAVQESLPPLRGHQDVVYSIALAPGGAVLASAGGDRTIRLWDLATGDLRRTIRIGTTSQE